MKKPPAAKTEEFFVEHLPYEIDMLRAIYSLAVKGSEKQAVHHAMVESFLLHARNLIEFFKDKDTCDFDPRFFTYKKYKLKKKFVGDAVLPRINAQVTHLSSKRTAIKGEKLSEAEWGGILEAIEGEIARFTAALTPEYKAKWKYSGNIINVEGTASGASSQVTIIR